MKKLSYTILGIFLWINSSVSQSYFNPESLKISIGFESWISQWEHKADGLVKWKDSKFYATSIDPSLKMDTAVLLIPSIELIYHQFHIYYAYVFQGIGGEFSHYIGSYKENNGTLIHSIQGIRSAHRFGVEYKLERNIFIFVEQIKSRINIGAYGSIIIIGTESLSGILLDMSTLWYNIGVMSIYDLRGTRFFGLGRLTISPHIKLAYMYNAPSSTSLSVRTKRNMYSRGGIIEIGGGYRFNPQFDIVVKYKYQQLFTNEQVVNDVLQGFIFGLAYRF